MINNDEESLTPTTPQEDDTTTTITPSFYQKYFSLINIVIVSMSFCVLFSSYNTTQGYVTNLKKEIGFWMLAAVYASFAITNLVSPAIVNRLGSKLSLIVGASPYCLFILSASFTNAQSWLLITAAVLNGMGGAILWTSHGKYLIELAGADLGSSSGIFFGIFSLNGIIGNMLAGVLLLFRVSIFWTFFVLFCLAVVGIFMMIPLKNPEKKIEDQGNQTGDQPSVWISIKQSLLILVDRRILLLVAVAVHSGYALSVNYGVLPKIIGQKSQGLISWCMAVFGASSAIGSIVYGKLIDAIGIAKVMYITLAMNLIANVLTWFFGYAQPYLFFVTLFFAGLADSGYNTTLYSILGAPLFFKDNPSDAVAAFKLVQCVGTVIGFIASAFLPLLATRIIFSVSLALSILSFAVLVLLVHPDQKVIHSSNFTPLETDLHDLDLVESVDEQATPE